MSVVEMRKVHLISLHSFKDPILKCLQQSEMIDIQEVRQSGLPSPAADPGRYDFQLAEVRSAISFLSSAVKLKKSFIDSFVPPKELISRAELEQHCREFDCDGLLKQCSGLGDRLANQNNLRHELNSNRERLLPWRQLALPLNELCCELKVRVVTGKIRQGDLASFQRGLAELSRETHLEVVSQAKEEVYLIVIFLAAEAAGVNELLGRSAFEPVELPLTDRTPAEEIALLEQNLAKTEMEQNELKTETAKLARQLPGLKYRYDLFLEARQQAGVKEKLADTRYTFFVEGWIRRRDFDRLKKELARVTGYFELTEVAPGPDERPPVALSNPGLVSPFELITKLFGLPKEGELDPSLPLSFFFALFFGLCLGDLGYGLTLALFSWFFLKRYRLPEGGRNLVLLLLFGGLVAMAVGLLTGSYFGFSPADLPAGWAGIKGTVSRLQVIDPVKEPLTMLLFSLALGVVQIFFGLVLMLVQKVRQGRPLSALIDEGFWIFFLSSLIFWLVSGTVQPALAPLASRLSLAGAVLLVLTQGRHKKTLLEKFLSGLLSIYKVSGYLGDTLSYSRLLALGMSSAIIGAVINILAGMVRGVPVVGLFLMAFLLVFGHLFNLVLSALGAFVHSVRLQMVEFFSKFYQGGGRPFQPYRRVGEYTLLRR